MYDGADYPEARLDAPWATEPRRGAHDGRPVFLHGMWRSGSTYLWSRFRAAPQTQCFYEPLHHGLARLTKSRIDHDTPAQISANRHPSLSLPYFSEFAPLIGGRGVRGYRRDLAYDRFALDAPDEHPKLERYIAGLVDHAAAQGRTAVLGFNRTGLRLAWMKARFSSYNIYIDREPAAIWASYAAEMAKGNFSFYAMWLTVLEKNADQPLFAPLVERLGLRPSLSDRLQKAKPRHRRIMTEMNHEQSYFMVFYLWLACTGHALESSDLLIDTRLADTARYPRCMEAEIAYATGLQVDLSEMRAAEPRVELSRTMRDRIEQSAIALFPRAALPRTATSRRRLAHVSTRKAELLSAVC